MKKPLLMDRVLMGLFAASVAMAVYQFGRQSGRAEALAQRPAAAAAPVAAPAPLLASPVAIPSAGAVDPKPLASAGDPLDQQGDIITPLNVRDPSALVMAPYDPNPSYGAAANVASPPPMPSAVAAPDPFANIPPPKAVKGAFMTLNAAGSTP